MPHRFHPRLPLMILAIVFASLIAALVLTFSHRTLSQSQTPNLQPWSMGFWTGVTGQPLSDLDWGGLTHIVHVAVSPNADGSLTYTCSSGPCDLVQLSVQASQLINMAHAHGVQALLNIGNVSGSLYRKAVGKHLNEFVNNTTDLVNRLGYDGVDIDWEQGLDHGMMSALVPALRQSLGKKLLTVDADGSDAAFWASMQGYLDRINAMTYDMVSRDYSWFNSALHGESCNCVWSYDLMKQRMLDAGVFPAKLNLGIPFYGWVSTGGGVTGPRQSKRPMTLDQSNYYALAARYDLSNPNWDSTAHVPWIGISNGWVTFENEQSIAEKVNYVKGNGLGGWIIWELEQDYLPNNTPKHPLLTAIKRTMRNSE